MGNSNFYIVGVGASAGGLEALEQMFRAMPEDCGMAFVIVQHLSPDFKSVMDELLARHTKMAIHRVEDGMAVQPNSLYLIPPKQDMIISDGRLLLTEKDPSQPLSLPIDHFLRSLAQDVGRRSIAVVLSGTGSDGSRGIEDIHDAGGLVIAQSPESAKFDGMPNRAIATKMVDAVVRPSEIASVLDRYAKQPDRSLAIDAITPIDETSIEHVFRLLQRRHGIDFTHYKPTTIGRRIERRIQMNHNGANIEDYVNRLEKDPAEVDQLYRDLLIGVTQFFRDGDPFRALGKDVLPELMKQCDDGTEFRVWVAACATGEEAYSVAILVDECRRALGRNMNVKIFATDVHRSSIEFAHAGIYPPESLDGMSQERRERYFSKHDRGYHVTADIRKMIVFAPHNLVKDAPFTRLSLVTCRNLLIYLRPAAQKKVLSLFHFGLKTGGIVMLGASESPGDLVGEFEAIDERCRIFRKRRDIRLAPIERSNVVLDDEAIRPAMVNTSTRIATHRENESLATSRVLLDQFMPPGILVNQQREVVQVFGGAGKYLSLSDGRITTNVLDLVDDELKLALTGGLQRSIKSGESVQYQRILVQSRDGGQMIRLTISPVHVDGQPNKHLITFEPLASITATRHDDQDAVANVSETDDRQIIPPGRSDDPASHRRGQPGEVEQLNLERVSHHQLEDLEDELRHTKENLQATIEEMETSNEELQATNEEMIASNEELQSTNEELHSVNEELFTVNAEYQRKISELTELTNDMDNLLVSTEVHTLFLDEKLCIRKFTPKMSEVFSLVPHDIGRRIDAFVHSIDCGDLTQKVRNVLDSGSNYEENVRDGHGHQFLMRVLPYKSQDRVRGVVLTLIDITSLVEAQQMVIDERERFERAITANRDGTWDWPDLTSDEMWWSPSCYQMLGHEPDEFPSLNSRWLGLIHPEDRSRVEASSMPSQEKCYVEVHREFEYRMLHKSGSYRWYCHRAVVDHGPDGKAKRMTGSVADIHDRKTAEMENSMAIRRRDEFLSMLSHELRNPMAAVLNAIHFSELEDQSGHPSLEDSSRQISNVADRNGDSATADEGYSPQQIIKRQIEHMARLLDDLLDVARFGRGRIEFRKQVIDLTELADEVVEAVSHEFAAKNQIFDVTICSPPLRVMGDPARLKQAQVNLLVNASRYANEGGRIRYQLSDLNDQAVITVTDDGEGIAQDMLEVIFEMFVQSDESLARSTGGMGIGLFLARQIVEAHLGTIAASSQGIGKGSRFEIRLPTTQMEPPGESPRHSEKPAVCKVLLVEDNDDSRTMLAKMLQLRGYEVTVAEDGEVALRQFEAVHPDVALIDIGLPVMDGYEVAKRIRKQSDLDSTRLIALTGYGRDSDRQMALDSGFDEHLVKPIDLPTLFEKLDGHVDNTRA